MGYFYDPYLTQNNKGVEEKQRISIGDIDILSKFYPGGSADTEMLIRQISSLDIHTENKTDWKTIGFIVGGLVIIILIYIIGDRFLYTTTLVKPTTYLKTDYTAYRRSHGVSPSSYTPKKY